MAAGFLIENALRLFAKCRAFSTLAFEKTLMTMANIPNSRENTYPAKPTEKNRFPITWTHLVSGVGLLGVIAGLYWLDMRNGDKYDFWLFIFLIVATYFCHKIPKVANKEGGQES